MSTPHANEWAQSIMGRYRRNFAGRDRSTRDLMLLDELTTEMLALKEDLDGEGVDPVQALELFRSERRKIVEAQGKGGMNDRAMRLGTRANEQFAVYQKVFNGQKRVTRRPALLQRVIDNLEAIHAEMVSLKDTGFQSESNSKNIEIVAERTKLFRNELNEIEKARRDAGIQIRSMLATNANDLFGAYRDEFQGKPRKDCDPDRLSQLCDLMHPIAREMAALEAEDRGGDVNRDNLQKVLSHLTLYEKEMQQIVQAKMADRAQT